MAGERPRSAKLIENSLDLAGVQLTA